MRSIEFGLILFEAERGLTYESAGIGAIKTVKSNGRFGVYCRRACIVADLRSRKGPGDLRS
jgi:hypothetical protein